MRSRLARASLALGLLVCLCAVSLAWGAVGVSGQPEPRPSKTRGDNCGNGSKPKKNCPTPSPSDTITASPSDTETPLPPTAAKVGFGVRKITPVGDTAEWPPPEWKQFFTPHPVTKVWGEPYTDEDGDNCFDAPHPKDVPESDYEPTFPPEPPTQDAIPEEEDLNFHRETERHVDQPWNSAGDAYEHGVFEVNGVTIYGDPQSAGKWDGLWANAGFGAKCTLGMHDDTWARAIVMEVGDKTVAMVSLDVVGLFNIEVQRARRELEARYGDEMEIDELIVSSTHTHEGVDTMGYWGQSIGIDGKFPAYNAFLRSQLIDAVADAYEAREPAYARFAQTEFTMAIRDSRPPHRVDPYLLAGQFVNAEGETLGTVVNWSNHPEAQGSDNHLVSSDFPHGVRETLEAELGGKSVYFSGSVGGLMTPLGQDVPGFGSQPSWERTFELGRLVATSAKEALATAPLEPLDDLVHQRREFYMQADNTALNGLNAAGVFDIPTYIGAKSWGLDGHTKGIYVGRTGEQFKTEMVAVRIGPALFLTVPGELFPELELGGYGRPECPSADTGRPYEPVIGEQFDAEYEFVLGLGQDELGYIVPGYDFWLAHAEDANGSDGNNEGIIGLGGLVEEETCNEGHYEETVSGSSTMAPWVACVAAELAGKDPWALSSTDEQYAACSHENTHINPYGLNPEAAPGAPGGSRFAHPPGYYEHLESHEMGTAHSHHH